MTEHAWDSATSYCTRCAVQKGWHAEECLATPNVHGMRHILAKRMWEREGRILTMPDGTPVIRIEAFPKEPE